MPPALTPEAIEKIKRDADREWKRERRRKCIHHFLHARGTRWERYCIVAQIIGHIGVESVRKIINGQR